MPRTKGAATKPARTVTHPEKRPKNTDITKVLDQVKRNPQLTMEEIGKINGVSHVAIVNLFKRHGIERKRIEEYKSNRADFMAGLQEKVLASITASDLEKASLRDKVISAGVLFDKERLERGQSTVNLASIYSQALESRTPGPLDVVLEPDRETGMDDNDADSGG